MRITNSFVAVLALLTGAASYAQYSNLNYDRPSLEGPSSRIGRTGGAATRAPGNVLNLGSIGRGGGGILNRPAGGFGLGGGRVAYATPVFSVLPGQTRPGGNPGLLLGGDEFTSRLGAQAGLTVFSPFQGVPALANDQITRSPYFPEQPSRRTFQDFFGLEDGAQGAAAAPTPKPTYDTFSAAVQATNLDELRDRQVRALSLFQQAMMPSASPEERDGRIHRVMMLLELLTRGGNSADLPELLMVHGALERKHDFEAIYHLLNLIQHNPKAFEQKPDLTSFFPDPKVLESQLRSHLRVGDDSGDSAGAYVLQAYCCWMLGENGRARAAVQKANDLNAGIEPDVRIREAANAIAAAAQ